jgi:hypothetical protein
MRRSPSSWVAGTSLFPNGGYGVPQRHIHGLQSLCDVIQWLLQGGLMGADLLWTFLSCHVQPLHRREMTMLMYPRPSSPNHSFSAELDNIEINTWIRGVRAHGAGKNFDSCSVPLTEGVDSPWVSSTSVNFYFFNTYAFLCSVLVTCASPHGRVTLAKDALWPEANHANDERQ